MHQVVLHQDLFNEDMKRTKEGPFREVDDIILREDLADRPLHMKALSHAKPMVLDLMRGVSGVQLGSIVIERLQPGRRIAPHVHKDEWYTRYQIVLQGLPGALFTCGDESVNMRTGEIWWCDERAEHFSINNSPDDRVHMLVDVRIDR